MIGVMPLSTLTSSGGMALDHDALDSRRPDSSPTIEAPQTRIGISQAMSICVAVTDNKEGTAALEAAATEAARLGVQLVAVNLTSSDLDTTPIAREVQYEVVTPRGPDNLDEVEHVLKVLEDHPEVTLLVVGVRKRSPIGKVVLGSIPQRLILDAAVPVLSVKADND
jgi:nucleotide-binding universal stress UspA family protein